MKRRIGKILILTILVLGLAMSFNSVWALDTGVSEVSEAIDLGNEDPRVIVARVINIAMIFLSIIAVGIILAAGFKWMTSDGSEEKVASAKKTLTAGIIGLVIVLSSWGIASFVLARMMDATSNTGGVSIDFCETGDSQSCGCEGSQTCFDGSWGVCVGSDCSGTGVPDVTCDGNTLTPTCDADNSQCLDGYVCGETSCLCEEVSIGDPCDADEGTLTCEVNDSACGALLTCDADSCLCVEDETIEDGYTPTTDAPFIVSYEPAESPKDQYVTIVGSNFGNSQGLSRVYFGDVEANYNFPDICLDSIWSDSQIIVKVPDTVDGNYVIIVEARGYTVDTDENNLDPFTVNSSLAIKPSLCKIEPVLGPANSPVILWGEYFGDNGSSIVTRFYSNRDQLGTVDSSSLADNVETTVHNAAFTGPVKVINNGIESNSLNFKVGFCSQDQDCGSQKCCPAGTYKEGTCTDSVDECFVDIPSSVYEWRFSTEWKESNPDEEYDVCSQFIGLDDCNTANEACCYNAVSDSCVSGDNSILEGDDAGYCAFYSCDAFLPEQCNYTPSKIGEYMDIDVCDSGCFDDPGDSICRTFDDDMDSCANYAGCCFNFTDDKCLGGNQTSEGYCDYFSCDTENPNQCEVTPDKVGDYNTFLSCDATCSSPPLEGLGNRCVDVLDVVDQCAPSICSSPFSCINSGDDKDVDGCGYCCCDPSEPVIIDGVSSNLTCVANQGACSGADRGLYCGCEEDLECGNVNAIGCGVDTCCHARPDIIMNEVSPSHLETAVCRNSGITIPFDSKMNVMSFNNNVLLLEEHNPGETCPAGTSLTGNEIPLANSSDNVYCSVTGSVHSFNRSDGTTEASFIPSQVLASDTNYYVVVKGDKSLDSTAGVISINEIGMNGLGYNESGVYVEGENAYRNSYIWKFTTLGDQAANSGTCIIDYVTVEPEGYLFQTTDNDLNENDSNIDDSFDTVKDGDKVFVARAFSVNDQELFSVSDYRWDWDWDIDNGSILGFKAVVEFNDRGNKRLIYAQPGITDGNALVSATTNMSAYENMSTIGDGQTGSARTYVFLCNNPWPAINLFSGIWSPWGDEQSNCNVGLGDCSNYNYSFYYCRDAGDDGVKDDLPAVLDDDAIIGGNSNLVCSDRSGTCSIFGANCGINGTCQWNVLKEFYFFNETPVNFGEMTGAINAQTNGEVQLSWNSGASATEYNIYYKLASSDEVVVEQTTPLTSCSISGGLYYCTYDVTGLINNEEYNFYISALVNDNEVFLSNELNSTPTLDEAINYTGALTRAMDVQTDGEVQLAWNFGAPVEEYRIYYRRKLADRTVTERKIVTPSEASCSILNNKYYCNYNLTGLINGDEYDIFIKAFVDNNEIGLDNYKYVTPTTGYPGEFIYAIDTQTGGEVQLSWNSETAVTEYIIHNYYDIPGTGTQIQSETFTPAELSCSTSNDLYNCTYNVTGLINNNEYNFAIQVLVDDNLAYLNRAISATPTLQ